MFNLSTHPLQFWRCKAVQNTFVCAIPIFSSTLQKLWIFPKYKRFFNEKFGLGRRKLRLPRSLNLLGAVTCGAQEVSEKKSFKIGKIRSFCKVLEKIGIAQTNVFCTALLGSFDSVMSVRLSVHPSGNMLMKRHAYIYPYVRPAKDLVMGLSAHDQTFALRVDLKEITELSSVKKQAGAELYPKLSKKF